MDTDTGTDVDMGTDIDTEPMTGRQGRRARLYVVESLRIRTFNLRLRGTVVQCAW